MCTSVVILIIIALACTVSSFSLDDRRQNYYHAPAHMSPMGRQQRGLRWDTPIHLVLRAGALESDSTAVATNRKSSSGSAMASENSYDPIVKLVVLEGGACPYAARTWMTVLELGLPFHVVEIGGGQAQAKPDWFLKLNPRGKVPVIENLRDGSVVYESAICNEYLCDLAAEVGLLDGEDKKNLMPVTAGDRARLRLLCDHFDSKIAPSQYTYFMNEDKEKEEELQAELEDALDYLETALAENDEPGYLMGSEFTLADLHVLPFFLRMVVSLRHFKGYQLPPSRYPRLLAWYKLCQQRESFQATAKTDEEIIALYSRFRDVSYKFGGLNRNGD